MSTIFPLSASVGQEFQGYMYDGTIWNLIGNEYNPTVYSAYEPDNPKPGDLWVDSSVDVATFALDDYLTIESASSTYATKTELENIDLSSASAAAVAAIVDSAPETLNTLNELAQALNNDDNFVGTVTTALSNKLDISTASATYATQSYVDQELANIDLSEYLTNSNASSTYVAINNMSATPVSLMVTGSSAQRPISPIAGMFRYNTSIDNPEWWNQLSQSWIKFADKPQYFIEYLIVAGGGGGGSGWQGGGGGAGGYIAGSTTVSSGASYSIIVGSGGNGGYTTATNGNNSSFNSLTAIGGGRGAYEEASSHAGGSNGGSGGGAAHPNASSFGSGTVGQGNNGGLGVSATDGWSGGGGGGAGSVGQNSNTSTGGNGGSGSQWVNGSYYAGGGGGTKRNGGVGSGGTGGGGAGGNPTGSNGTVNTGGGGGSGTQTGGTGPAGAGGSGIVIIRYSGDLTGSGGVTTTLNGYTYHTFTSSGIFVA